MIISSTFCFLKLFTELSLVAYVELDKQKYLAKLNKYFFTVVHVCKLLCLMLSVYLLPTYLNHSRDSDCTENVEKHQTWLGVLFTFFGHVKYSDTRRSWVYFENIFFIF